MSCQGEEMRSNGCVERVQRRVSTPRTPHTTITCDRGVVGPGVAIISTASSGARMQEIRAGGGAGGGGGALHAVKIQGKLTKRKNAPHEKNQKFTYFARNGPKEAFPLAPAPSADVGVSVWLSALEGLLMTVGDHLACMFTKSRICANLVSFCANFRLFLS
jgi:hypothetical protein